MSTYTKRQLVSATAIDTTEKIIVIIEHRATVFRFDYSNIFPIDGPLSNAEN